MNRQSPLERLAAVQWSLDAAPALRPGGDLHQSDRWLGAVSDRLSMAGVLEAGMVATTQARVQLSMGGALSYREDGRNWAYKERVMAAYTLQGEVIAGLTVAQARLAARMELFERITETAIRVGAEAHLLAAPGGRPRAEWLDDMMTRMASHPSSAPHIVRLALSLSEAEVLSVIDRTFTRVFDV